MIINAVGCPYSGTRILKELLKKFENYRVFGEWFEKSSEIMNYIKMLKNKEVSS